MQIDMFWDTASAHVRAVTPAEGLAGWAGPDKADKARPWLGMECADILNQQTAPKITTSW